MLKKLITSALLLVSVVTTTTAQTLTVSTGYRTGSYSSFFKSLMDTCPNDISAIEMRSTGGVSNVENILAGRADIGFVQLDTLEYMAIKNPLVNNNNIQILLPLYPEQVHIVVYNDDNKKLMDKLFGRIYQTSNIDFEAFEDLEGIKVGAWGGSYITAKNLSYLGGVKFEPVLYYTAKDTKKALEKGVIGAALVVGGAPLPFITDLTSDYSLLSILDSKTTRIEAYDQTVINYPNMATGDITTLSSRALLVTRNYPDGVKKRAITKFRYCVVNNWEKYVQKKTEKMPTEMDVRWKEVDILAVPKGWLLYK